MQFENRDHAARLLARKLAVHYKNRNALALGISPGALPMAKIIADSLSGELDVVLVHKLGHPSQPQLAIGAVDESGNVFLSDLPVALILKLLKLKRNDSLRPCDGAAPSIRCSGVP
jgi:putative phosphoribosyl transferase